MKWMAVVGVIALAGLSRVGLADEDANTLTPAARQALEALRSSDIFAALELVESQADPKQVGQTYLDVALALYYDHKDLPNAMATATAGTMWALRTAKRADTNDPKLAKLARRVAMMLTYNLASFTWPGWAEPGIDITSADRARGLDAAKAHVRIVEALGVSDVERSRAHWVLGAQWLAAGKHDSAGAEFLKAADLARAAGETAEALNSVACARLAAHLAHPDDAAAEQAYEQAKHDLDEAEADDFFTQQVRTAETVFSSTEP